MKTGPVRLIGIGLIAVAASIVWTPISRLVAVDSCLDAGGSYDYSNDACDFEQSHPYPPYRGGGSVRFKIAGAIGIIGVLVLVFPRALGTGDKGMRSNNALERTRDG